MKKRKTGKALEKVAREIKDSSEFIRSDAARLSESRAHGKQDRAGLVGAGRKGGGSLRHMFGISLL